MRAINIIVMYCIASRMQLKLDAILLLLRRRSFNLLRRAGTSLTKPPMKNEFLANRHDAICQTAPHHRFRKTDKNPKIVSVGERKIEKMSIFENVVDNYLQK